MTMDTSAHVADISANDFATRVIERSHRQPVLVDFWAPWCGPCRTLSPILERLAEEYAGKLFVAKVNTDVEQELALAYRIRGIPAVKLFRDGKVVDEFVGVQPEPAIRAFVERFLPNELDALIERALSLGKTGQTAEAVALLREAVDKDARNDRAKIALAQLLCERPPLEDLQARLEECEKLLDSLSIRAAGKAEVEQLRFRLKLWRIAADAPPRAELERAVATNPADLRARYQLAARLAAGGDYEPALEHLLEIARRDRRFEDDAGRKTAVGIFHLLGNQHPLVVKYRALLSRILN